MDKNKRIFRIIFYPILAIIVGAELFPIFIIVTTSFKTNIEIWTSSSFLILRPTLENYIGVFIERPFTKYIFNSLIIALSSTAISVIFGAVASYGFTRFKFPGNRLLNIGVLISRLIPPIALSIPIFLLMKNLRLLDTHLALIIAHTTFNLSFAIWLMIPFFQKIPLELEDAARIDGCSRFGAFRKVFIPLAAPGLITTSIFCFILSWNEFLFALVLTSSEAKTAPLAISGYIGQFGLDWAKMTAGATVMLIPALVFTLALQKYFVEGLTFGILK